MSGPAAANASVAGLGAASFAFAAVIVVLALAVPILASIGFHEVVDSRSGRLVDQERDPAAPGFEAVVERTPTALLVQLGEDGTPVSLTALSLGPGDEGGAVLFIPLATLVDLPSGEVAPLGAAYGGGGLAGLREATALAIGIGFDDDVEVDSSRWSALIAPVAPVRVENPDDVAGEGPDGEIEILFPAGPVTLTAEQAAVYLATQRSGRERPRPARTSTGVLGGLAGGGRRLPDPGGRPRRNRGGARALRRAARGGCRPVRDLARGSRAPWRR